ncbi:trigger factor [Kaarinaea lacus]
MQVSVESTSGLERRMKVAMPKAGIDSEVQKRLKSLAGRAKIDGFRPGKVPFGVIQKKYGGRVQAEVLNEMMQSSFYEAVTQEKLRPAGVPLIEPGDTQSGDSVEFTATFEVYPEVELKGLDKVKVERPVLEIDEKEIDKMIENIRTQRKTWKEVDRAAKNGDQVIISFVGTIEGEEFKGGSANEVAVELGAGRMIKGFEEQLVGTKAGDEKVLSMSFPDDYHAKDLAGKPVEFATTVVKVGEPALPELDDEFIASFGIKEGGVDALRQQVRENMEREAQQAINSRIKEQLFEGLMKLDLMEIPKALIDSEIEVLIKQRQEAMQQYGGGAQVQDVQPSEFEEQARRRVTLGLILAEAIQKNDIKVPPAKLREKVEQIAASYERPDDVVKYYYSDKSRLAELENVALEEMAVEKILEETKVSDKKMTFDALMNPGQTAG